MRIAAFVVALLVVATASAQDLSGAYLVTGTNEDGSSYEMRAELVETDGGLVEITTYNGDGMPIGRAVGIHDGTVLSTIFQTLAGNGDVVVGVASYRFENDRWLGKWHVPGTTVVLKETLMRSDPRLHGAEFGPRREL